MHFIMNNISVFKLPIEYVKKCHVVSDNVRNDLEMVLTDRSDKTLYNTLFDSDTDIDPYCNICINQWNKFYTTDKTFLKDTCSIIKTINTNVDMCKDDNMFELYNDISNNDGFMERYVSYIEWSRMESLNRNERFLQLSGMYHIIAPLISIIIPIAIFFVPFLLLKMSNVPITIDSYISNLKHLISRRGFDIRGGSETNVYLILSIIIYIIQIYHNSMACIKFRKTICTVQSEMCKIQSYLRHTNTRMSKFIESVAMIDSYKEFCIDASKHYAILNDFMTKLDEISSIETDKISIYDTLELGKKLKGFYVVHNDESIRDSISYSIGFNGYINNMLVLNTKYRDGTITSCKFNKKRSKIKGGYFIGTSTNSDIIRNTLDLSKNIIITGPNASGKTTIMKGMLFNNILSQQIGCGCYRRANIMIYDNFHSYMNIPDTSGRDSLFQAEARRCKEIIQTIETQKGNHLCIFDELYSGTNPTDAVSSAMAFIGFIDTNKSVSFMLTTHYTKICEYVEELKGADNYHMDVTTIGDRDIQFTYNILKGISTINGGVNVLKMMQYPDEILNNVIKYSKK